MSADDRYNQGPNILDDANIELGKALLRIKWHLDIYTLIGLNAKMLNTGNISGKTFMSFVQSQSLAAVVLWMNNVFERERPLKNPLPTKNISVHDGARADSPERPEIFQKLQKRKHDLCSVTGVCRLAKCEQPNNIVAAQAYVSKHGIIPSDDWKRDVEKVFSKNKQWICERMKTINKVRHTRLAHMQQDVPEGILTSIAAFEELLTFAYEFHAFVNRAFLSVVPHSTLDDTNMVNSLMNVLKKIGISEPVSKFEDT